MRLSDYVFDYLKREGVEHIFMLPGGGSMFLVDSLGRSGILYTAVLHEQAGAIAAYAHAMYTGKLGVELVTSGPGGTNAVTGCAAAWAESVPVLFISGQAKRETLMGNSGVRQMGSQEVNIIGMVEGITKYAVQVLDPQEIRHELEMAVHCAKAGRPGPVWLDIPVDVQGSEIDPDKLTHLDGIWDWSDTTKSILNDHLREIVEKVLRLLAESKRPIILAGYGIQAAGAEKEFLQLVDMLGVPVLTTWKALGLLPDDHPLYIGRPGKIGQRAANFAQQTCDLLISIGARLDFEQVAFQPRHFAPKAKKVIVDVDLSELGKLDMDIELRVARDAGEFIRALQGRAALSFCPEWLERCHYWKQKYPVVLPEYRYSEDINLVNMYAFMDDLSDAAAFDDVLAPGSSGKSVEAFMQAWKVKDGQKFIFAPALGIMGFDIPMALGACIASKYGEIVSVDEWDRREQNPYYYPLYKRTLCVTGDGGFQLNIQDLETVHRLNLPIKFFVFSNGGYGSIMSMQKAYFDGRLVGSDASSGLTLPDLQAVAGAYQIPAFKIMSGLTSKPVIKKALETPGPVICEVMTDPYQAQQPRVTSRILPDGSIESAPMEDLYPFLDRDEFNENMEV